MLDRMSDDICWDIWILTYQNFNWYQSRHPVLFLGEILGKVLSGHGQGRSYVLKNLFELEEVHMVVRMVPRIGGWTIRIRQWRCLKTWCFNEGLLC